MKKIILYFMFIFVILISNNSICSHEDINRGNLDAIDSIPIVAINKNGEIYDINPVSYTHLTLPTTERV